MTGAQRPPADARAEADELAALRAERDYYRLVAERTGRKALADFSAMASLIAKLRRAQEALREAGLELERKVEERTAAVVRANSELRAEIAERIKAEQAARESEEMYRLLTATAPDAITVVDPTGAVLVASEHAVELFGLEDASEALGQNVIDWVAPEERERAFASLGRLLELDELKGQELALLRRGGARFVGSVNAALVRDAEGAVRFAIFVTTDVTLQKRAEAELLKGQKLESLGVLAGGIAHDFNNLLTAVLGNLSLGVELAGADEELRQCLRDAEKASLRARDLTKQLLTFSRGGQPVKKVVALDRVLDEAAHFSLRGSAARCEARLSPDLWSVEADEGQLAQVVNNLVINAVQAMTAGGVITVRADNETLAGDDPSRLRPGRYVRVEVSDTGAGIPREHLSRIFDPYFTTKQTGSGLGLAVAYSIVRNHGGAIQVDSEVGVGTTFTIHLPAIEARARPAESGAAKVAVRSARVLVMDDEKVVRDVALRALALLGCRPTATCDGAEAIEAFREAQRAGDPFDLVIMDLTVPGGMGGVATLPEIRAIDPAARVIVSSGYSVEAAASEHREHGFDGALPKPYRLDDLRGALAEALGPRAQARQ